MSLKYGPYDQRGYPTVDPEAVERFWSFHGWTRHPLDLAWEFDTRADLDAVVRIELPTAVAGDVLSSYDGTSIDYAVNLWSRSY